MKIVTTPSMVIGYLLGLVGGFLIINHEFMWLTDIGGNADSNTLGLIVMLIGRSFVQDAELTQVKKHLGCEN